MLKNKAGKPESYYSCLRRYEPTLEQQPLLLLSFQPSVQTHQFFQTLNLIRSVSGPSLRCLGFNVSVIFQIFTCTKHQIQKEIIVSETNLVGPLKMAFAMASETFLDSASASSLAFLAASCFSFRCCKNAKTVFNSLRNSKSGHHNGSNYFLLLVLKPTSKDIEIKEQVVRDNKAIKN